MDSDKPVGTILYKEFPELGPDVFDLFIRTYSGWVAVDQYRVQPGAQPVGRGYTDITPREEAQLSA